MGKSIHIRFKDDTKQRNPYAREKQTGAGSHNTREQDVERGSSRKDKHKKPWEDQAAMIDRVASLWIAQQEAADE